MNFFFFVGNYLRSVSNSQHLSAALVGNYPGWNYNQISSTAIAAVEKNGICEGCSSNSYVPISELALTKVIVNETKNDFPNIEIQEDDFFDIDESCDYISTQFKQALFQIDDLLESEYGVTYEEAELNALIDSLIVLDSDDRSSIGLEIIAGMYDAHVQHGLNPLNLQQKNIQYILDLNIYEWIYDNIYQNWFDDEKFLAKLYDSSILSSCLDVLYGISAGSKETKKVVGYMMHNNNLYALMQLLMSDRPYYPYYSESMVFKVYSRAENDGKEEIFVNAFINNEIFTINGCLTDCLINEFYEILESNIIDSESFCANYNESTQMKNIRFGIN